MSGKPLGRFSLQEAVAAIDRQVEGSLPSVGLLRIKFSQSR